MSETVKIKIDGTDYEVPKGITLIQACDLVGVEIPRFCYHDRLSIAGNCRMCLVELSVGPPKPQASCATQVFDGLEVKTKSDMVKKAREGAMEFLLANHPLDCPICDQGGECDLQDQAMFYGCSESRFLEDKRAVPEKSFGPLVKTHMTRCIHCTRCVRFSTEVAGVEELGAVGRGESMEISTYVEKTLSSELSGNIIDLCPVGALTSKPYAFTARPWELTKTESIDIHDAVGSNIRIDAKGSKVMRILPRLNEDINEEWISDKTRFACDGLNMQRIDQPYIRKSGKLVPASFKEAINLIAKKIEQTQLLHKEVAALAGDLADIESLYILKEFLDEIGCKNYDARPYGSVMKNDKRADYLFNSKISNIEEADLCLIISANPRKEAAILNSRIRKQYVTNKNFIIANIGVENDLSYPYEQLGNTGKILEDILYGKNDFSKKLKSAKKPLIIIGEALFCRNDAESCLNIIQEICEKYNVITSDWNGYNILHNSASRVGALDIDFVPAKGGKNTKEIYKAIENEKINLLFLLGYDAENIAQIKNSFNIYIGTHGDRAVKYADIILPSACYTEKHAHFTNLEGVMQNTNKAVKAPGLAMEDWQIINEIKKIMQLKIYKSYKILYEEMLEKNPKLTESANDNKLTEYNSGIMTAKEFTNYIDNFYQTNVIARASVTMGKCVNEIENKNKNG